QAYQDSLKYYRDLKNVTDTAWEEGTLEGLQEGLQKGLQKGLEEGLQKGLEEGLQKGLEAGLQKGEQAGIEKAVLAMHRQGLSIDFIAATLNLPGDAVEYLVSNIRS
ncbi:MAG: hypothetical protein Q8N96_15310, partial [Methylovulum sp.]|nr:hypothetical protein [Methylovulum sp.]